MPKLARLGRRPKLKTWHLKLDRDTKHPVMTSRRHFVASTMAAAGWYRLAPAPQSEIFALVLGTVQDGGLPQAGCYTPRCEAARRNPRYVASVALIDPDAERYYLVDATPDLTRQIDLIPGEAFRRRAGARRPFDCRRVKPI